MLRWPGYAMVQWMSGQVSGAEINGVNLGMGDREGPVVGGGGGGCIVYITENNNYEIILQYII